MIALIFPIINESICTLYYLFNPFMCAYCIFSFIIYLFVQAPLHLAMAFNEAGIAQILLINGANPNVKDEDGMFDT